MKKFLTVCVVAVLALAVFTQDANAQRVRVNVGGGGFNRGFGGFNRGFNNGFNRGFGNGVRVNVGGGFGFNNFNNFNRFNGFNNRVFVQPRFVNHGFVQPRFFQPRVLVHPGFNSFNSFSSFSTLNSCGSGFNSLGFSACDPPVFIQSQPRILIRSSNFGFGGGFCH